MAKPLPPKIWLSSPHMGGNEANYVQNAFDTNWIAPLGPHVDGFEAQLQDYLKIGHAAALSSGTAALHLALILAGIGPGDLVLCSSFTFSASANPIVYQGATPVFIDSEEKTWNMDPDLAEQAIQTLSSNGQMPKAMVLVHLYGMPAQMDRFEEIARKYNITIIEDAAEALGSHWNGKMMGSFGAMGILSFNGNKIITTSGGGALVSKNAEWIAKARFLATQARDPAPHYQHSHIGYNYRLSNVLAGIGRGQMEVLPDRIVNRRANFSYYHKALSDLPGIEFHKEPDHFFSNRWLTCLTVDPNRSNGITREDIRLALEKENIESRPLWKPMHLQPVFSEYPCWVNGVSEKLFEHGLCLPSGSNLSAADLQRVVFVIRSLWNQI
ncbi:MAG TPA: aminotransferase class I/II-fold pyridoxal phosphate-dependent enzyme [Catalimonadaceae bacterium]|nr:aminotransferase class I/II-fold pyridoxal phosphate-dependent enzyme [Catalimonadaceae bacterium]